MIAETRRQLIALGGLMLVLAWVAWEARRFPDRARIFPQLVSLLALALCVLEVVRLVTIGRTRVEVEDADGDGKLARPPLRRRFAAVAPFIASIAAYYLAILAVGFPLASFLFVALFLRRVGEVRWIGAFAVGASVVGFLFVLSRGLNIAWPDGFLPELLGIVS